VAVEPATEAGLAAVLFEVDRREAGVLLADVREAVVQAVVIVEVLALIAVRRARIAVVLACELR